MANLKADELEVGKIYYCRVSERRVFITSITEVNTPSGKLEKVVTATSLNPITGSFDYGHPIYDYSLSDVPVNKLPIL